MMSVHSNIDLFTALRQQSLIWPEVLDYLGNEEYLSAVDSLDTSIERGRKQIRTRPPHAFLVGEWGLSGICMGYALESVKWVSQHGSLAALPPLMDGHPNESIKNLEKLLVLAVYQSISKGVDPQQLNRTEENRGSIDAIGMAFTRLQRRRTGIQIVQIIPGPSFSKAEPLHPHFSFETAFPNRTISSQDHFLFVMNPKGCPIFDWHVIYVNPSLGVIGDAASALMWRVDQSVHRFFPLIFQHFLRTNSYAEKESIILHVTDGAPSSYAPLLLSRVGRRIQTGLAIWKHQGIFTRRGPAACAQYFCTINRHNPLVLKAFPDTEPTRKSLEKTLEDHGISSAFFVHVKSHLGDIYRIQNYEDLDLFPACTYTQLVQLKTVEEIDAFILIFKNIQSLGPKAHRFSSALQATFLRNISKLAGPGYNYPKIIVERLIPAILELRTNAHGELYDLTPFMNITRPDVEQIPYFRALINAGADPNGNPKLRKLGLHLLI